MRYFVYILTNPHHTTLYVGVTNDLKRRVWEHRNKVVAGFAVQYNLTDLVYFEEYSDVREAIMREKQVKGWRRQKKDALIAGQNPNWEDRWDEIA